MKKTFILSLFIFWGFIIAIISAGYVVKDNRLAQEAMQKLYDDNIKQISENAVNNPVIVQNTDTTVLPPTKPTTKPGTGSGGQTTPIPKPTQAPIPIPTPPPAITPPTLTMSVVATHNIESDCWIVISGKVYSVTPYIPMHPGGARRIINECGGDATSAYGRVGHSSFAHSLLGQYLVGNLQ